MMNTILSRMDHGWSGQNARKYFWTVVACLATTLVGTPLLRVVDPANIVMLFLLTVVLIALRFGRGPALLAAVISVGLFDFFFVPPRFSFTVSDGQYLITFAVMLAVALIIGGLTARVRLEADTALARERRVQTLYDVALELSTALTAEQVARIASHFIDENMQAVSTLLLPDKSGELTPLAGGTAAYAADDARAVYERGESRVALAEHDSYPILCLPLRAPTRVRGVLIVGWHDPTRGFPPEQRRLFDTVATLLAVVIERIYYAQVSHEALLDVESERLRNSLLSTLSHDLRTPLTVLVGLADSLVNANPRLAGEQAETAVVIRDESLHMSRVVNNLLDMARLQGGQVQLRKEWQPLEEVIGSSLKTMEARLAGRSVTVDVPRDLPLLQIDAVLVERVLCNLLDNAAKYAPEGTISLEARRVDGVVEVAVSDRGPGLTPGTEETMFEMFARGHPGTVKPGVGVGLGLAICRAIVSVHGGHIRVGNRPEGGASFLFTLPVGTPPAIDKVLMERMEREVQ
jgi:two-component system, OmpR family, sensor histidine kinase KdpD